MNLAKLKYRDILRDAGGPIAEISVRQTNVFGSPAFECFATLEPSIKSLFPRVNALYGNSDGCGTGSFEAIAVYKAISECIERWSWKAVRLDERLRGGAGINIEDSTSGFAAYPGFFKSSARPFAYFEAAERWSLRAWWEGLINHCPLKTHPNLPWKGIELLSPIPNAKVVILWAEQFGITAYGFAAGSNVLQATNRAKIELCRNLEVVRQIGSENEIPLAKLSENEKSLIYFANEEGRNAFNLQLANQTIGQSPKAPKILIDDYIDGPWSKYAHVWRCLFDPYLFLGNSGDEKYFYF